jgi:hypothetical protein
MSLGILHHAALAVCSPRRVVRRSGPRTARPWSCFRAGWRRRQPSLRRQAVMLAARVQPSVLPSTSISSLTGLSDRGNNGGPRACRNAGDAEGVLEQQVGVEAGSARVDPPAALERDSAGSDALPLRIRLISVAECGIAAAEVGVALPRRGVRETLGHGDRVHHLQGGPKRIGFAGRAGQVDAAAGDEAPVAASRVSGRFRPAAPSPRS